MQDSGPTRSRDEYNGIHAVAAGFVAVTAVIVALGLPLLSRQADWEVRLGVICAFAAAVGNGLSFVGIGWYVWNKYDATTEADEEFSGPWQWQMATVAVSVALVGLALLFILLGQWNHVS